MRVPLVKEHGAWFVFVFSCAAGIIAGSLSISHTTSDQAYVDLALAIAGIALLINAKSPAVSLIRAGSRKGENAAWLALFFFSGMLCLMPFLAKGFIPFVFFAPLIIAYFMLIAYDKEHLIVTEVIGFSLLTIGVAVTYFILADALSVKLYAVVLIFFSAGVFKVRLRLKKTLFFRQVMVIYCLAAVGIYMIMGVSFWILLPLTENILYSIWLREEKLKVIGNTELVKGLIFLLLFSLFFTE
jgi:hypothetical protein